MTHDTHNTQDMPLTSRVDYTWPTIDPIHVRDELDERILATQTEEENES